MSEMEKAAREYRKHWPPGILWHDSDVAAFAQSQVDAAIEECAKIAEEMVPYRIESNRKGFVNLVAERIRARKGER